MRLTSTDTLCVSVLPGVILTLQADQPGLSVTLHSFNNHANFAHGEVDIAIRPTNELSSYLEGEIIADLGFAAYGTIGGADTWLGLAGNLNRSVVGQWMSEGHDLRGLGSDSFLVIREMVAVGQGRGYLPCVLGDSDQRMARLSGPEPIASTPIWLADHKDLADTGRLWRARRALAEAFVEYRPVLSGRPDPSGH